MLRMITIGATLLFVLQSRRGGTAADNVPRKNKPLGLESVFWTVTSLVLIGGRNTARPIQHFHLPGQCQTTTSFVSSGMESTYRFIL